MRTLFITALLISLSGCSAARQAVGAYGQAAEKGIEISVGDSATPPDPATLGPDGRPLPSGLVGDTVNRAYTSASPN